MAYILLFFAFTTTIVTTITTTSHFHFSRIVFYQLHTTTRESAQVLLCIFSVLFSPSFTAASMGILLMAAMLRAKYLSLIMLWYNNHLNNDLGYC